MARASCELGNPSFNGCHLPIGGGVGSQVAEAEVFRRKLELVPFPLSVFSSPSQHCHPHLRRDQCWSKRSGCGNSAWIWAQGVAVQPGSKTQTASELLPV